MAAANESGLIDGIRIDVVRMHETWMELFFPRQRAAAGSVLGKWKPKTSREKLTYNTWYYLGIPVIAVLYPLVLLGYVLRFQSRKLDSAAIRLGTIGVFLLMLVLWGGLTGLAYLRFSFAGFIAVGAASAVAILCSLLAVGFRLVGGRGTTVFFAYPFAMTAIFLPPSVAALYSPTVADAVFPYSENIAIYILDNYLTFADVNTYLRTRYNLEGIAYAGMWFGIAVPLGWVLGILVTLADLVRPKPRDTDDGD
jgi:hypothetical protein